MPSGPYPPRNFLFWCFNNVVVELLTAIPQCLRSAFYRISLSIQVFLDVFLSRGSKQLKK